MATEHLRKRTRKVVLSVAGSAAAAYGFALLLLYSFQRRVLYDNRAVADGDLGPGRFALVTSDRETLDAVFLEAREPGRPAVLYLHGNNPSLTQKLPRLRALASEGFSVLAIDWRGFGRSTGAPSEQGLERDAASAFDWLTARVDPARVVVLGESLGTGVAVDLATKRRFAGLVLEGAYSSMADVAEAQYPIFPVHLLMKDPFDSAAKIGQITMPLLQQHGTADATIPLALGERLFAHAPRPKTFVRYEGADHNELPTRFGSYRDLARFVEEVTGAPHQGT